MVKGRIGAPILQHCMDKLISKVIAGIVVAVVAIGALLFGISGKEAPATPAPVPAQSGPVGGATDTNGIDTAGPLKTSNVVTSNGITRIPMTLTLSQSDNFEYWSNPFKDSIWIDHAAFTASAASSSERYFLYASTTSRIAGAEHYTNPTIAFENKILTPARFATSTTATTTAISREFALNSSGVTAGLVELRAGMSVIFWKQNASGLAGAPNGACNGSTCEAATSTNSGDIPAVAYFSGYSTTTQQLTPFDLRANNR